MFGYIRCCICIIIFRLKLYCSSPVTLPCTAQAYHLCGAVFYGMARVMKFSASLRTRAGRGGRGRRGRLCPMINTARVMYFPPCGGRGPVGGARGRRGRIYPIGTARTYSPCDEIFRLAAYTGRPGHRAVGPPLPCFAYFLTIFLISAYHYLFLRALISCNACLLIACKTCIIQSRKGNARTITHSGCFFGSCA